MTILTTNTSPAVTAFVAQLKSNLVKTLPESKVTVSSNDSGLSINIPKDTLVVAVGTQALNYASNLDEHTPVIGVLVPKSSYETISAESKRKSEKFSAIYLDQPFSRQMSLIKNILPNTKTISVLLGSVSQFQSNDLQKAAKTEHFEVNIRLVNKQDELQDNLEKLLTKKNVLLAIPDPMIYTRETAQTILLTTYHHQTPIVGFSQSYAKSGALAAVFTNPETYANEVTELIATLPQTDFVLPEARPAIGFSIAINRQVAKSLGISVPSDEAVYAKMLEDEQ